MSLSRWAVAQHVPTATQHIINPQVPCFKQTIPFPMPTAAHSPCQRDPTSLLLFFQGRTSRLMHFAEQRRVAGGTMAPWEVG